MPELMAGIIDVEVEAKGMANRKGILDKINDLYNNIADIYKKNWYKIEVNEEDMTQAVGFDKKLNYSVFKDNDIVPVDVVWESSNEKVAKVNNDGILSVVGIGQSVITCSGNFFIWH